MMKSRKIRFLLLLTFALLVLSLTAVAADVHSLGYNSVDANEIRWGGSNYYSSNRTTAIANWNSLNHINIAPDDAWHVEDLTFSDVNLSDVTWTGRYTHTPIGADKIEINNYYLNSDGDPERTNTFLHELGHALGIGDHDSSQYSSIAMYYVQTSITSPQSHDIVDYNNLWAP